MRYGKWTGWSVQLAHVDSTLSMWMGTWNYTDLNLQACECIIYLLFVYVHHAQSLCFISIFPWCILHIYPKKNISLFIISVSRAYLHMSLYCHNIKYMCIISWSKIKNALIRDSYSIIPPSFYTQYNKASIDSSFLMWLSSAVITIITLMWMRIIHGATK